MPKQRLSVKKDENVKYLMTENNVETHVVPRKMNLVVASLAARKNVAVDVAKMTVTMIMHLLMVNHL